MLVELRENGARDPESDVALVLTLRPYHIRGNSAREFSWSERRVSFGCSKEEHALVVRRVEIDGADGRLLSRFIVDEHTSGPWRNPASLPLPESVFGIDRVLSNRRSRYTRPGAALVPAGRVAQADAAKPGQPAMVPMMWAFPPLVVQSTTAEEDAKLRAPVA